MTKRSEQERKIRERIQGYFWDEVGAVEHISIPELENAVRREFKLEDGRRVKAQISLMRTEGRIRIESRVKVWIKPPSEQ